jgi:UrcA family protein
MIRSFAISAMVATLALAHTTNSYAADHSDYAKITVKFGDLNVSTREGAIALYGRIRAAARSVCPPLDDRALSAKAVTEACVSKAVKNAVTDINQPALFAVYNEHSNMSSFPSTLLSQRR